LWDFNENFPKEFKKLNELASKYHFSFSSNLTLKIVIYNFGLGVWLSPWGGYEAARERRLEYGRKHELEINDNGFSLSGPKYLFFPGFFSSFMHFNNFGYLGIFCWL
jgi:hypothetical protein